MRQLRSLNFEQRLEFNEGDIGVAGTSLDDRATKDVVDGISLATVVSQLKDSGMPSFDQLYHQNEYNMNQNDILSDLVISAPLLFCWSL